MLNIISERDFERDGQTYHETVYSNGSIVTELKTTIEPSPIMEEPQLSEMEEAILNTNMNTEYLVALAELDM